MTKDFTSLLPSKQTSLQNPEFHLIMPSFPKNNSGTPGLNTWGFWLMFLYSAVVFADGQVVGMLHGLFCCGKAAGKAATFALCFA
jgi:hypothetical protein